MPKAGTALPAAGAEAGSTAQERVVVLMAIVIAIAAAGVLHLQAGLSLPLSVAAGIVTLAVALLANTLASRNAEAGRLRLEIARLELELARLKTQNLPNRPTQGELETGVLVSKAALPAEARWDVNAARRGRATVGAAPNGGPVQGAGNQGAGAPTVAADQASQQQPAAAADAKQQAAAPASRTPAREAPGASVRQSQSHNRDEVPSWAAPSAEQGDALRADWEKALGEAVDGGASQPVATERPEAPRMPPVRTVESDLELVQRKIKALADEVNANENARSVQAQDPAQPAIEESITALRTTAERMKPRKGFSARPNYSEMTPQQQLAPQQPAMPRQPAPVAAKPSMAPPQPLASAPPQAPARQPAQPGPFYASPSASPAGFGSAGELPSLDALIPATAQPIAVSGPSHELADTDGPQTIAAMPQTRAPAPGPGPAPRRDYAAPEPARAPEPPREHYAPAAPRPAPAPAASYEPAPAASPNSADRRAAPGRRLQDQRIAEIAAAIQQRRMDVYLNPIVGLGDYAVTHFEVDVRLRADAGGYIDDAENTLRLQSTDMLALFDIERLERTARVAEQLEARGKTGAVLSPTTGHSMSDGDFLEAFARTFEARTAISGQLVLTFTQADVSAFGPSTWQALADMHSFGFRFALQEVTHLSMDFAALAERGFGFVKLPASAFLDGLPAGHGLVPPADICRHLAGAGLTLVVESIDDDQLLGRVFGFGALYGQGSLFGGSRQITLDALGPKRAA